MGRIRAAAMIILYVIQLGSKSPAIANESPQDLHFPKKSLVHTPQQIFAVKLPVMAL